jgi:hypothetical protein
VSGDIEAGDGVRVSTFPESWGPPPGRQYSEERASWVKNHVREHMITAPFRRLAEVNGRLLAILRAAELDRRHECP